MAEPIYIEVEENENSEYMPMQVYEGLRTPRLIHKVRLIRHDNAIGIYDVTGWSSEIGGSPCPAMYVPVSDSGQAVVHLVFGGDWGIRLRRETSSLEWRLGDSAQFGEPYLMLTDESDLIIEPENARS